MRAVIKPKALELFAFITTSTYVVLQYVPSSLKKCDPLKRRPRKLFNDAVVDDVCSLLPKSTLA